MSQKKALILDTGPLIVYLLGLYNPSLIQNYESKYTKEDFIRIRNMVIYYKNLYVTPEILAELTNRMDHLLKGAYYTEYIKILINELKSFSENYVGKSRLSAREEPLMKFGFTDLSVLLTAIDFKCIILTVDGRLTDESLKYFNKGVYIVHYDRMKSFTKNNQNIEVLNTTIGYK